MLVFLFPLLISAQTTDTCLHRQAHPHKLAGPIAKRAAQYEQDVRDRMKGVDLKEDLNGPWNGEGNRYLAYRPHEGDGLGNRILGTASAWILSLLTDRILLVASPGQVEWNELFCEPFFQTSWLWPMPIEWFQGRDCDDLTVKMDRNYPSPVRIARINLDHRKDNRAYQALVCRGDLREDWQKVKVMVVSINQWLVPLLMSNPQYRSKLQEWFPEGDGFTQILSYLFHPANSIWQRIQPKLNEWSQNTVAIHLRDFAIWVTQVGHFDKVTSVMTCIQQHSLNTKQVYLATMNRDSYNQLSKHYNVTYEANSTPTEQLFTTEALQSAMLDMYTLSQAQDLILSPGSTMGYIAQALAGRPAWLLDPQGCTRYRSHEPCLHAGFTGSADTICNSPMFPVKAIRMETPVQWCQDFTEGWQIQVNYTALALRK